MANMSELPKAMRLIYDEPAPYGWAEWWMANRPKTVQDPERRERWARLGDEAALELFVEAWEEAQDYA